MEIAIAAVPPRDDLGLALVLKGLAGRSWEERRGIGLGDRARVASLFSMQGYVAAHEKLYRCAAEGGSAERARSAS